MSKYAMVENGVVLGVVGASVPQPNTIEAPDNVSPGWLYDGETFTQPPEPQQAAKPRVVIVGLMIDGVTPVPLASRVILIAGQSLGVTVNITIDGQALPITDDFAVPISRVHGDVDQTVRASFVDGVAQMLVPFDRSGEYAVTEEWLNYHLPPEQQMDFDSFYISVTRT
jgi:hypothetical protein